MQKGRKNKGKIKIRDERKLMDMGKVNHTTRGREFHDE